MIRGVVWLLQTSNERWICFWTILAMVFVNLFIILGYYLIDIHHSLWARAAGEPVYDVVYDVDDDTYIVGLDTKPLKDLPVEDVSDDLLMPLSGGSGTWLYLIAGNGCVLLAGLLLIYRERRKAAS